MAEEGARPTRRQARDERERLEQPWIAWQAHGSAADKFDESLGREKSRTRDLDELFRKANEKLGRKDDE